MQHVRAVSTVDLLLVSGLHNKASVITIHLEVLWKPFLQPLASNLLAWSRRLALLLKLLLLLLLLLSFFADVARPELCDGIWRA